MKGWLSHANTLAFTRHSWHMRPAHLACGLRWLRQSNPSANSLSYPGQHPTYRWHSAHYTYPHHRFPTTDGQRPTWTSAHQLPGITALADNDPERLWRGF